MAVNQTNRSIKKALAALSSANRALDGAKKAVAASTELLNQLVAQASAVNTVGDKPIRAAEAKPTAATTSTKPVKAEKSAKIAKTTKAEKQAKPKKSK